MILQMMSRMAYNSNNIFTPHEMEEGMGPSMDLVVMFGTYLLQCELNTRIIQEFNKFYVLRV